MSNITLPIGTSNHGDPELLCLPTKWTDVIVFFLGNYLAHAATLRSVPGRSMYQSVFAMLGALFFPVSGVTLGVRGITSLAALAKTDLQVAARAGALCKVIKTDISAQTNRERHLSRGLNRSWRSEKIHGRITLPPGYGLAIVPKKSKFKHDDNPSSPIILASNLNAISILIAIGQLAFAVTTIYRTRGDQTKRYGYAAFGLTVTQYALMSLINLVGNLICPQYPALYLVRSKEMDEALEHPEAVFEGYVGELVDDECQVMEEKRRQTKVNHYRQFGWKIVLNLLHLVPTAISLAIIGGLTRFERGQSTHAQRVWTMTWLAVGSYVGALDMGDALIFPTSEKMSIELRRSFPWVSILPFLFAAPAIGGFVVVGQMLSEFGACTRIT